MKNDISIYVAKSLILSKIVALLQLLVLLYTLLMGNPYQESLIETEMDQSVIDKCSMCCTLEYESKQSVISLTQTKFITHNRHRLYF